MLEWIESHQELLAGLTLASAAMFVTSLLVMPALIVRIPADYFAHPARPPSMFARRSLGLRMTVQVVRCVAGFVLILGGMAMLILPGQGLLTILVGLMLLDVPGKYRLEKWFVRRRWVRRPVNWLRRRAGREPLQLG